MSDNPKDASDRQPEQAIQIPENYGNPWTAVKMDIFANNNLIAQNGVLCMHYASVPDVINQRVEGDLRDSFDQMDDYQFENNVVFKRENGHIYIQKKPVFIILTNNSTDLINTPSGLYGNSGAYATVNRWYQNTNETVHISQFDKMVPCSSENEIIGTAKQKFRHNNTGVDRLNFPIVDIEFLVDSDGKFYQKNVDFDIIDGVIKWKGHNRPGNDPVTGKGKICSARFQYKRYFYIKMVPHDFRSTPVINSMGQAQVKRGPMQAVLQADEIFLNEKRKAEDSPEDVLLAGDTDNEGYR